MYSRSNESASYRLCPKSPEENNAERILGTQNIHVYSRTNSLKNTQTGVQLLIWQFGARKADLALTKLVVAIEGGNANGTNLINKKV